MNWELKSLTIEFAQWGEYKGKYTGKIQFANGDKDAFTFTLSTEQCAEYLAIVSKTVGKNAAQLGSQITESLKYLELPTPVLEISESTQTTTHE